MKSCVIWAVGIMTVMACILFFSWDFILFGPDAFNRDGAYLTAKLQKTIVGADRIVLEGMIVNGEKIPDIEISNQAAVHEFVGAIELMDVDHWSMCSCLFYYYVQLYDDDTRLATLSFPTTKTMQWIDGEWPGDTQLTEHSAVVLRKWLATFAPDAEIDL